MAIDISALIETVECESCIIKPGSVSVESNQIVFKYYSNFKGDVSTRYNSESKTLTVVIPKGLGYESAESQARIPIPDGAERVQVRYQEMSPPIIS